MTMSQFTIPKFTVTTTDPHSEEKAELLAKSLGFPFKMHEDHDWMLIQETDRLSLQFPKARKPFCVDFVQGSFSKRLERATRGQEPIARAVGLKSGVELTVLDGTAGWGSDAFLLAKLGAHVIAVERSPVVLALLKDGIERARTRYPDVNITLQQGDTVDYLEGLKNFPDVIYLDPMFPEREDAALVKKPLQLLQDLLGEAQDGNVLVEKALGLLDKGLVKRVVVKRPIKAPALVREPHHIIDAGIIRFDVYVK